MYHYITLAIVLSLFLTILSIRTQQASIASLVLLLTMIITTFYIINSQKQIEKFIDNQSDYNEPLEPIERGLTIYSSVFSKNSYPEKSNKWRNISGYFSNNSCPDVELDYTHFKFVNMPSYSREKGFFLLNNSINGPMSHQMGISANESFTIFFTMKFDLINSGKPDKDMHIINLYANTISNNGLSLYLSKDFTIIDTTDTLNVTTNINMVFGQQKLTKQLIINNAYTYMFAIVKDNLNIKLFVYPNIDSLSVTSSNRVDVASLDIDPESDILLSNKEMRINGNNNLPAFIYNIGVYNYALALNSLSDIYTHTQKEIHKDNFVVKEFSKIIKDLVNEKESLKTCPYDEDTCTKCVAVKDWSDMTDIVTNATNECLESVNSYCIKNPSHDKCVCWNPSNVQSKSEVCKKYVKLFDNKDEQQTINEIKQDYNLCSCDQVQNKNSKQIQDNETEVRIPNMIHKAYDNNKSDMELYKDIVI